MWAACRPPAATGRSGCASPQHARSAPRAQATIDSWGGTPAIRIELASRDGRADSYGPDVAAAERLVLIPNLAGVVGHANTRTTLLAGPVYAEAGIPLVVPAATSRLLSTLSPWVFPMAPDEDAEGEFLVRFVTERLGARRVTVVYRYANEYTRGLLNGVVLALGRRALDPVDVVGVLEDSDFDHIVGASVGRAVPDAVIVAAGSREAAPVARAFHVRVPAAPIVGGDAVSLDQVLAAGIEPECARHLYGAELWHPNSPRRESRAFMARWLEQPGPPPTASDVMFYDGLVLLARAVREVGPDRKAVQRYLRELGRTRPAFEGVGGSISFAPDRPINLVMTRVGGSGVTLVDGF
jgi:branched-chain amino acid transport system substrate-binding protein